MNQKTKAILLFVVVAAFTVLIFGGVQISRYKPPVPDKVVGADGRVLFTGEDIMAGQKYYLARGGQHMGSVWGHGAYLAPDWSADALHRMALVTAGLVASLPLDAAQRFDQSRMEALEAGEHARVSALVAKELKANRYDAGTSTLRLSPGEEAALPVLTSYCTTEPDRVIDTTTGGFP